MMPEEVKKFDVSNPSQSLCDSSPSRASQGPSQSAAQPALPNGEPRRASQDLPPTSGEVSP